jgi:hypothetical protein
VRVLECDDFRPDESCGSGVVEVNLGILESSVWSKWGCAVRYDDNFDGMGPVAVIGDASDTRAQDELCGGSMEAGGRSWWSQLWEDKVW